MKCNGRCFSLRKSFITDKITFIMLSLVLLLLPTNQTLMYKNNTGFPVAKCKEEEKKIYWEHGINKRPDSMTECDIKTMVFLLYWIIIPAITLNQKNKKKPPEKKIQKIKFHKIFTTRSFHKLWWGGSQNKCQFS